MRDVQVDRTQPKTTKLFPHEQAQRSASKALANRMVAEAFCRGAGRGGDALILDTAVLRTTRALLKCEAVHNIVIVEEKPAEVELIRRAIEMRGLSPRVSVVCRDVVDFMLSAIAAKSCYPFVFLDTQGYGDGKAGRYNDETNERGPCQDVWPTIIEFIRVCGVRRFAQVSTGRARRGDTHRKRTNRWRRWLWPHLPAHTVSYGYQTAKPSADSNGTQVMSLNIYTDEPANTPTLYNISRVATRGGRRYAQRYGYGDEDYVIQLRPSEPCDMFIEVVSPA